MAKSRLFAMIVLSGLMASVVIFGVIVAAEAFKNLITVIAFGLAAYSYAQFSKRDQRESDDFLRYGMIAFGFGLNFLFSQSGIIKTNDLAVLYGLGVNIVIFDAFFFLQKRQYFLNWWLTSRK